MTAVTDQIAHADEISTCAELTALVGEPIQRVRDKVRPVLHELDRQWLAASPFCLVATSDADGRCDVSPKGDPAGQLAYVLDEQTIAIAERPGNKRMDGYRNVLANPHVGLIFFIPGRGDTLRINGRARLVRSADFFDAMIVKGHRPILALVVEIEEVFHHCAKAFLRSQLWQPETWRDPLPPRPVIAKTLDAQDQTLAELTSYYGEQYREKLYR
ncbi:MAG: pyridoxamine 5'-phosphate oxidase family protein [Microlunatus sp.]